MVHRQQQQQHEDDHGEDRQGAELTVQVGARAFLDCFCDLLHLRRALVGFENLSNQDIRKAQCGDRDYADHHDQALLTTGYRRRGDQVG